MGLLNIIRLANDYNKLKKFVQDKKDKVVSIIDTEKIKKVIERVEVILDKIKDVVAKVKKIIGVKEVK